MEAVDIALHCVLNDFNWAYIRSEAAASKNGLGTVVDLLAWQLATLQVSMVTMRLSYYALAWLYVLGSRMGVVMEWVWLYSGCGHLLLLSISEQPSCIKACCILHDVISQLYLHSTVPEALAICEVISQPLANVWSIIINKWWVLPF